MPMDADPPGGSSAPRRRYTSENTDKVVDSRTKVNETMFTLGFDLVTVKGKEHPIGFCFICMQPAFYAGMNMEHIVTDTQYLADTGGHIGEGHYNSARNLLPAHSMCNTVKGTTDLIAFWQDPRCLIPPEQRQRVAGIAATLSITAGINRMTDLASGDYAELVRRIYRLAC